MESVVRFLEENLRLRLNREKSAVAPVGERKFLGHRLLLNGKLGIAPKSIQRAKQKIRQITRRNRGVSLARVIVELNLFLVGWITYYRYAACRFDLPMPGHLDSAKAALLSSQTTQAREVPGWFPPAPGHFAVVRTSSGFLGQRLVASLAGPLRASGDVEGLVRLSRTHIPGRQV
jgi:hypothetical protein